MSLEIQKGGRLFASRGIVLVRRQAPFDPMERRLLKEDGCKGKGGSPLGLRGSMGFGDRHIFGAQNRLWLTRIEGVEIATRDNDSYLHPRKAETLLKTALLSGQPLGVSPCSWGLLVRRGALRR